MVLSCPVLAWYVLLWLTGGPRLFFLLSRPVQLFGE